MSDTRPHLLLVMTDQQRHDTLGALGASPVSTPHLDRLAREGLLFDHAYVPVPLCSPSRASIFTGQYPGRHGLATNGGLPLPGGVPTLLDVLRGAGYRLMLAGKDHLFDGRSEEVFDAAVRYSHLGRVGGDDEIPAEDRAARANRRGTMGRPYVELDPTPLAEHPTHRITDAAIGMLGNADRPCFCWVSYPDPHPPYMAPEPYASMYRGVDWPLAGAEPDGELATKPVRQALARRLQRVDRYPPEQLARLREVYAGMVSLIDHEVGRLVSFLRRSGLAERTVLAFLSDHGDYLGDHGMVRKSPSMYDCLVRIPLLLWGPGRIPARRVDGTMVESIDLAPTLCELAGKDAPSWMQGRSLLPVIEGRSRHHKDRVFGVYGTAGAPLRAADIAGLDVERLAARPSPGGVWLSPLTMRGRMAMIRTPDWKLVHYAGGEGELYHMAADPEELRNLYGRPEHAGQVRRLQAELLDWALDQAGAPAPG